MVVKRNVFYSLNLGCETGLLKAYIIVKADEVMHDKKVCFIDFDSNTVQPNGRYAILCMLTHHTSTFIFDNTARISMYKNKINTGTTSHFGTYGKVFGFGSRASFRIDDHGLSIAGYANKVINQDMHRSDFKDICKLVETTIMDALDKQMRIVHFHCEPFCMITKDVIEKISNKFGSNAKEVVESFLGNYFTSYYVNIDVGTTEFHTEFDVTYTFIHVPGQDENKVHDVCFMFLLNDNMCLSVNMSVGVSLTYSAYFMTHRQECKSKEGFINLSAYTNRRFIWNLNASSGRDTKSK